MFCTLILFSRNKIRRSGYNISQGEGVISGDRRVFNAMGKERNGMKQIYCIMNSISLLPEEWRKSCTVLIGFKPNFIPWYDYNTIFQINFIQFKQTLLLFYKRWSNAVFPLYSIAMIHLERESVANFAKSPPLSFLG